MKKIALILCLIIIASVVAVVAWQYSHWQQRKREIATQLVNELQNLGVTSSVEIRKSKLDADDLKYKIWFRVPDDDRIVDVFWCENSFQFEVHRNGKRTTMSVDELRAFLGSNKPDAGGGL